ncbi:MAG: lipid IV(A) 3-deoxy-D-manno-octulosonic acid transferase, partial [Pseudomonadales bacterium]|nr:lipid IV(A) 3-deoxy-D-manno-octulosonic acid transferase [Pseudomonadales bacterium]
IWIHAVSVGEVLGSAALIRKLLHHYPQTQIVVTTMTPTGSDRVKELFGDKVIHCYAPYDLPGPVRRFIKNIRPEMLILFETEIWPNTIHQCYQQGIPVLLANGRMSARSAKGYRKLSGLTKSVMIELSAIAAQSETDGQRFIELGCPREKVLVSGSVKFDVSIPETLKREAAVLRTQWAGRPSFIAASTHEGEDEQVLEAFAKVKRTYQDALLILVPRHPERFDDVATLITKSGFELIRRSSGEPVNAQCDVLLGDTMGELLLLYGCVDVAFVAGSLVPRGGHNMLEPAAWAMPVLSGPHLFNFQSVSELLLSAEAMLIVEDSDALAQQIIKLFSSHEEKEKMGKSAEQVINQNRGALDKQFQLIQSLIKPMA